MLKQYETRICLDCGKERKILKNYYPSNYCRTCSLKLINKVFRWDKVKKYMEKEYKRGLRDGRSQIRNKLYGFVLKEFPYLKVDNEKRYT